MPQRAYLIGEMVLGSVAVAFLLLLGANVYTASTRGSSWRKRVLGAGIFVLIFLGFLPDVSAGEPAEKEKAVPAEIEKDPELERALRKLLVQRPAWKKIDALRDEVWRIFEGKKAYGDYDWTGKHRIRFGLEKASGSVASMRKEGRLTASEAAFMNADLRFLSGILSRHDAADAAEFSGVGSVRAPLPTVESLAYLRERLP
ncbi:MAG: hypothetical protein ACYS47_11615, partial [Planctomycetota bacterium]